MGITLDDIRRAVSGNGDVSSFAEIYRQSLNGAPVEISSNFSAPVRLPRPHIFLEVLSSDPANKSSPQVERNGENRTLENNLDLQILPVAFSGDNLHNYVKQAVEEIRPDVILLECSPVEFSALTLYVFSLSCAAGMAVQTEIRYPDNRGTYLNLKLAPDHLNVAAILSGWLRKIPLWPVGKPAKPAQLTYVPSQGYVNMGYSEMLQWQADRTSVYLALNEALQGLNNFAEKLMTARNLSCELVKSLDQHSREEVVDQACYVASRILDFSRTAVSSGRRIRGLALVDILLYPDLEYLLGLFRQDITDEIYVEAKSKPDPVELELSGTRLETPETRKPCEDSGLTAAQEIFQGQLERFVQVQETEILTRDRGRRLIVEIADRTRRHPEISRGVSVRGTIAFEEIAGSLALMHGGLTRECIFRAALIALPPRLEVKQKGNEIAVISDIAREVLYDFSYFGTGEDEALNSLSRISAQDILEKLNQSGQFPAQTEFSGNQGNQTSIVLEMNKNQEILQNLEKKNYLKKDLHGQYSLTQKALDYLLNELEARLRAGEITEEEFQKQKARLRSQFAAGTRPQLRMSAREMAGTILEIMDAQDKQWNREINFQTMHTYYHIKEHSEGSELSPEKRDYYSLQKLIDDLEKRKIITAADQGSGFLLTGLALETLLKHLLEFSRLGKSIQAPGKGKELDYEHRQEVRRYSSGDAFRDISLRRTLKEIARQRRSPAEVRKADLRVFIKQPRQAQSDIILCLDTSGSMGFHRKLMYARLIAAGLVQAAIQEKNRIGLVAFNDYGRITIPLTENKADSLMNCLAGLTARGNTNIGEGIKAARELLFRSRSRNQKQIVLVSDGQPTAISETAFSQLKERQEKDLTEESALLETRQAAARGIQLSVVHIAGENESGDHFIKELARAGKGKISRIGGPDDLKKILR